MIFEIDTELKIVKVKSRVPLSELVEALKNHLGEKWSEYSLEGYEAQITYYPTYPVFPSYPIYQPNYYQAPSYPGEDWTITSVDGEFNSLNNMENCIGNLIQKN